MKFLKHTNITLREVGDLLRKKLQDELKFQKHNATGRLSRGLKYNVIKKGLSILNVTSSVAYWKAVNNPAFAKIPNLNTIQRWMKQRNIKGGISGAIAILSRIKTSGYGNRNYPDNSMRDAYVVYQEGNYIPRRTNFAGYVADKHSKEIAAKLAPSIGIDVANMISDQIKKNKTKTNVTRAF